MFLEGYKKHYRQAKHCLLTIELSSKESLEVRLCKKHYPSHVRSYQSKMEGFEFNVKNLKERGEKEMVSTLYNMRNIIVRETQLECKEMEEFYRKNI